jgi:tRNA nucleotidyltransferase (CCA-adding enzyme)
MKTYIVGGAVRDKLLGLPVSDRDHVVVGATVDEMLAAAFKPVGREFPVFLHPATHEEYALARTERKVAPGYAGFVFHAEPTVTLEEDLARRDLTINAIAEDEATHRLVDPFGGQRDLERRVFRHVGPAFVEDPVRILRLARFAARFADFSIADETLALMREMVARGEVDALVPERVWQEVSRGLMEPRPSRMIAVLRDAHALARLLPEIGALFERDDSRADGDDAEGPLRRTLDALDRAAHADRALDVRFAVLLHAVGANDATPTESMDHSTADAAILAVCSRYAAPRSARELALMASRERSTLIAAAIGEQTAHDRAEQLVLAMERCDAFRRVARFRELVAAIESTIADAKHATMLVDRLATALDAAVAVDAGLIARHEDFDPLRIAPRLHAARVDAVIPAMTRP